MNVMPNQSDPSAQLAEANASAIIAMAWQDDTPFEAIELQFGLSESAVVALMRSALKARSFRLWRTRVRGRMAKHKTRQSSALRDPSGTLEAIRQDLSDAQETFPLPPSPLTRASLR